MTTVSRRQIRTLWFVASVAGAALGFFASRNVAVGDRVIVAAAVFVILNALSPITIRSARRKGLLAPSADGPRTPESSASPGPRPERFADGTRAFGVRVLGSIAGTVVIAIVFVLAWTSIALGLRLAIAAGFELLSLVYFGLVAGHLRRRAAATREAQRVRSP